MPLTSLTLSPSSPTIPDDGAVQFTATGHWDDGHSQDVSDKSDWVMDTDLVATVNSTLNHPGLVLGVSPGTAHLHAGTDYDTAEIGDREVADTFITVTASTGLVDTPEPEGRFLLAFDALTLDPYPEWTRIDDYQAGLVASYTIDRGRSDELASFDAGRATVEVSDTAGVLDPTNPAGPFYGRIRPLMQAALGRRDPVTGDWKLRYRGFVDDLSYELDPSQKVNRLVVSLVDLTEVLAAAEMQPGQFGMKWPLVPPPQSTAQIYFLHDELVQERINAILTDYGLARRFRLIFPGNVYLQATTYSAGEPILNAIQECVDAEFPGVAVLVCDRYGRLCFRDRRAKFFPATVATEQPDWDYNEWKIGDGAAVHASISDTAQIRAVGFNRGVSALINSASAVPADTDDDDVQGQLVVDPESIRQYGVRSWSANSLVTLGSSVTEEPALVETALFAQYYVDHYNQPHDRITHATLRSLRPDDPRGPANWALLNGIDLGDTVTCTFTNPGGGGFAIQQYTVEGIHEQTQPLTPDYDDVTLQLDLSRRPLL